MLTRLARSTRHMAGRRRSSGAWAAVAAPAPETEVEAPVPLETYAETCAAARDHLHAGHVGEAVAAARRALEALPRGLDSQRLLGLALLEAGDARPAANAFAAALGADPLDLVAQVGLAEAVERLEGPGAAEAAWRRAWELEPGVASVGDRLQAARRAAGVLDVKPGPPPLSRAALTRIHLRGRLFEHAAVEARAVLAKEPDRVDARLSLAEAYWRAGDTQAAGAVAAEIVERQPECVAATLLLAAQWQAEGRDAAELLSRVRSIDPDGSVAQRLFDDREVPSLAVSAPLAAALVAPAASSIVAPVEAPVQPDLEPAPEEPVTPPADLPAEAPLLAETQPMAVVEPPPREVMVETPVAEPAPVEPVETRQPVQADELITLAPPRATEAPEPSEALALSTAPEPLDAPPLLEPTAPPAQLAAPAAPPTAATGSRAAGDDAMRAGRYLDAARAYGAWLRGLRGSASENPV